ncbi:MAG TPA: hypothetical protein VK900_18650 [Anaerolineales bacterium]|nr:hypothetical protein [Anaerolineales bacterium]
MALQIILIALGLLLAYIGNELSTPVLFYAGIACLGLAIMVMGWEGIITRRMVLRRRRGSYRATYTGVPAIFQGVQFNFIGLFLIAVAAMMYFNNGREIFLQMIRRPGLVLVLLGGLCLLQAAINFAGAWQMRQGSQGFSTSALIVVSMLPVLILVVVGLGLGAVGVFETVAPASFDEMGGALLEQLYGAR